jgi:DNA polymerase III epsilon subunit-like protein
VRETFLGHLTHLAKLAQVRKQKQLAFTFYRAMKQLRLHDESDHIASIDDLSRVKGIGPFILKQLAQREKRLLERAADAAKGEKKPRKPRAPRVDDTIDSSDVVGVVVSQEEVAAAAAAAADAVAAAAAAPTRRRRTKSIATTTSTTTSTSIVDATSETSVSLARRATSVLTTSSFVAQNKNASDPIEMRRVVIEQCRRLAETRPIFIDTETTGFRGDSEIIEVAAIDFDGTVLVDSLVQPVRDIDRRALEVHGITLDSLVRAPRWPLVWPHLRPLLAIERSIGAYNAPFDRRLLRQTNSQHGIGEQDEPKSHAWFCVQQLMMRFASQATKTGRMRQFSLAAALEHMQESTQEEFQPADVPFAHRALADAHNTRKLFLFMANQDLKNKR